MVTLLEWHVLLGLLGFAIHLIVGFIFDKYQFKDILSIADLIISVVGGALIFLIVLMIEIPNIRNKINKINKIK